MKLTDSAAKNAKPNPPKTRKLFDGRGLYLEITRKATRDGGSNIDLPVVKSAIGEIKEPNPFNWVGVILFLCSFYNVPVRYFHDSKGNVLIPLKEMAGKKYITFPSIWKRTFEISSSLSKKCCDSSGLLLHFRLITKDSKGLQGMLG